MAQSDKELAALFLNFSREQLVGRYWPQMQACAGTLTTEQLWWRPNPASNSIGNLLLHLNGNVRQWLVTPFNRLEDKRDRAAEFAAHDGATAEELTSLLGATIAEAAATLDRLSAEDLLAEYPIRGNPVRGLDAIAHVVAHFALHYGQIAYITKQLSGQDLGFH